MKRNSNLLFYLLDHFFFSFLAQKKGFFSSYVLKESGDYFAENPVMSMCFWEMSTVLMISASFAHLPIVPENGPGSF